MERLKNLIDLSLRINSYHSDKHDSSAVNSFYRKNCQLQGCDCAADWLILANSATNFVISEISVNQVRKCFPVRGFGVFFCCGSTVWNSISDVTIARDFCTFLPISHQASLIPAAGISSKKK